MECYFAQVVRVMMELHKINKQNLVGCVAKCKQTKKDDMSYKNVVVLTAARPAHMIFLSEGRGNHIFKKEQSVVKTLTLSNGDDRTTYLELSYSCKRVQTKIER